jgi:sporadic carbohydrate cluster 2OG-Fe(II) oxygenase
MSDTDFRSPADVALGDSFLRDGCIRGDVESRADLDRLRGLVVASACRHLGVAPPADEERWLDRIGDLVAIDRLNDFRLAVIAALNAEPWVRLAYFNLARRALESVVGNELCMQRRINLSIQVPDDDSSLLPLHSDTWAGDSPYEAVLWIPFTRCHGTKAMFLLPPDANAAFRASLHQYETEGTEAAFRAIEDRVTWIEIDYGQFLLFDQNLPHGNRVNREAETRWSANCRFKSVFTPYADKRLGEFFEPITLRPASRIGLAYELPGGFDE